MGKKNISVIAKFTEDGRVLPQTLIWEDDRKFPLTEFLTYAAQLLLRLEGPACVTIAIFTENRYTCIVWVVVGSVTDRR